MSGAQPARLPSPSVPLTSRPPSCFVDGQFQQAIGIALESRRLDKLEEAVKHSADPAAQLSYTLRCCQSLVTSRDFRHKARA